MVCRCIRSKYNWKNSIKEGTWFSSTYLLLEQAIKLTYYWVYKAPLGSEFVIIELQIGSEHTIAVWYNFTRKVCIAVIKKKEKKRMDRLEESVKKLKQTSPSLERGRNEMVEFVCFFWAE